MKRKKIHFREKACLFRHQFFAPPTKNDGLASKKSARPSQLHHFRSTCFTQLNKVVKFHFGQNLRNKKQNARKLSSTDSETDFVATVSGKTLLIYRSAHKKRNSQFEVCPGGKLSSSATHV